jgi:hypothetical protein
MNIVKTPIAILPTILRAAALLLSLTGLVNTRSRSQLRLHEGAQSRRDRGLQVP